MFETSSGTAAIKIRAERRLKLVLLGDENKCVHIYKQRRYKQCECLRRPCCCSSYITRIDQSALKWPTDQTKKKQCLQTCCPVLLTKKQKKTCVYLAVCELLWLHAPVPAFPVFSSVSFGRPVGQFLHR